jgi:prepilin peptidase CpaA
MLVTAPVTSQVLLFLTAAVLFYVAFADLKHYKIRNEFILVLTGLFFVHALVSGRWAILHWNIGFAALLFVIMLFFYSKKMMGGGDLKLLTVAFLWVGPSCALPFAIFLLFFSGIYIVVEKLKWVQPKVVDKRKLIAFAPSIAAALIATFMMGCLRPI